MQTICSLQLWQGLFRSLAQSLQVLRIADEKVNLAHQIYDFVDRNICRLDKELRGFDAELNQERGRLGLLVSVSLFRRGQHCVRYDSAAAT